MVQIQVRYEGELHCNSVHGPSGTRLATDAPVDNQGRGESFSPTDLVATALGTCMLTTMGIVAKRHGWAIEGASATVEKIMVADPARRIGKLDVKITMPGGLDERARETLERTAHTCPVAKSLAATVELPVAFEWGTAAAKSRS
jgi:putative redox protein